MGRGEGALAARKQLVDMPAGGRSEAVRPELLGIAEQLVAASPSEEEVEVFISRSRGTSIRAYRGEVESLESSEISGAGVRVVIDGRQGFSYAASLDEALLLAALEDARDNARFATPDEHAGLPAPDGASVAPVDGWSNELATFSIEDKVAMALQVESRVRGGDPRITEVPFADYEDAMIEEAVVSTLGICASARRNWCSVSVQAIASGMDSSATSTGFSVSRDPALLNIDRAVRDALERSVRLLGARPVRSGQFSIVMDARVTAALLAVIAGALSGERAHRGQSFLEGRSGERIAGDLVSIVEDPTNPAALGASSYDAEGLACRRHVLVADGVLEGFVYDTYASRLARGQAAGNDSQAAGSDRLVAGSDRFAAGSAVRSGFSTAPVAGCRAISFQPGDMTFDQVLERVQTGLFVQSVTGIHSGVNPVSGDFSVGAEGLMIRGGSLAEPVRKVTIASTLQRMLQSVLVVGGELEWLPGPAAGQPLAIADLSVSGS